VLFRSSSTTFAGTITTATGRTLTWHPKMQIGLPTRTGLLLAPDGSILLSIDAKTGSTTSGRLLISPALAGDPDRAALITLAFALCNEQGLLLHLVPGIASRTNREPRFAYRLRAFRPDEGVGAWGPVTTGKFGLFIAALALGSLFLWMFSITLWGIDSFLLMAVVLGLGARSKLRSKPRSSG
jgi:hypothetical protein